eukprot:TRINITY_DN40485_c0_g1_i1.p1 TRINITY_DN40485_c0_g1~~TRINITY_DN40485_c0_g1_i1.p1  ORF type:complete len:159 (-),score=38.10 TRINITY_DN40485_c0_g1_i1:103-579(-)
MRLTVSDPKSFTTDTSAVAGVKNALASVTGAKAADITVTLAVANRRLAHSDARRLQTAGDVDVSYSIRTAGASVSDKVVSAVKAISTTNLGTMIVKEIKALKPTASYTVSVKSKSDPTKKANASSTGTGTSKKSEASGAFEKTLLPAIVSVLLLSAFF